MLSYYLEKCYHKVDFRSKSSKTRPNWMDYYSFDRLVEIELPAMYWVWQSLKNNEISNECDICEESLISNNI